MKTVEFYPMSHRPKPSIDEPKWSETVLVYDLEHEYEDLGYFDFEQDEWHVLGSDSMILTCWIAIPKPNIEDVKNFKPCKHNGYQD